MVKLLFFLSFVDLLNQNLIHFAFWKGRSMTACKIVNKRCVVRISICYIVFGYVNGLIVELRKGDG